VGEWVYIRLFSVIEWQTDPDHPRNDYCTEENIYELNDM